MERVQGYRLHRYAQKHVLTAAAFAQAHRTQYSTHRATHIAPTAALREHSGRTCLQHPRLARQHRDAANTMRMLADCGQGQPGLCAGTTLTCIELLQLLLVIVSNSVLAMHFDNAMPRQCIAQSSRGALHWTNKTRAQRDTALHLVHRAFER